MTRKELKKLGLTDAQIDTVMESHGKVVKDTKEKADQVEGLETQIEGYKGQLQDRDKQLEDLKKVDAEGLQAKIDELQETNKTQKTEHEAQLQKQAFEYKLESTLSGAKAKNAKAVKALLDLDTIKLDGDTLKGLDSQLEALKKSDAYLFDGDKPEVKGVKPADSDPGTKPTASIGANFAQSANEGSKPVENSPWG